MAKRSTSLQGYLRRRTPWWMVIIILLAFIPLMMYGLPWFTRLLFDAQPAQLGGADLNGAQVAAAQQAITIPLGIVLSKLVAALLYFFVGVGVVWWIMHYITPALPTWAKGSFSTDFATLPTTWRFVVYICCWVSLLFYFALSVLSASLVQ